MSGTETDSFRVLRKSFCGEIKIICAFRNPRNPALRMYVHGHWPLFRWPVVLHSTKPIFFLEKSFFCKRGQRITKEESLFSNSQIHWLHLPNYSRQQQATREVFQSCCTLPTLSPLCIRGKEKASTEVSEADIIITDGSPKVGIPWECFNQIIGRNLTLLFFLQSSWSAIWQNTVEMGKQR